MIGSGKELIEQIYLKPGSTEQPAEKILGQ